MNAAPDRDQVLAAALKDPARQFRCPADVAVRDDWTVEQRHAVLRQWKYDIGQHDVATEENMLPGDQQLPAAVERRRITIGDVHKAIESLGISPNADSVPTKGA